MYKNYVITIKIPEYELIHRDVEQLLHVFVTLLEICAVEVVGEINYEEIEDEENE